MIGITRFKLFKKSGGRIYIPQQLLSSPDFPFSDSDLIKITIEKDKVVLSHPQWWELLDWNEMRDAFESLPQEIKDKIQASTSSRVDDKCRLSTPR